jgi:hypothetical protein
MDYPAFVQMVGMLRSRSGNVGVEVVRMYVNRIRIKTSGRWKQWMRILMEERINAGVVETTHKKNPVLYSWSTENQ